MVDVHPSFTDLTHVAALVTDDHRAAPAAVVAAAQRDQDGTTRRGAGASGRLWYAEDAPATTAATYFDLASVTKPIVALAGARQHRTGSLRRDEHLGDVIPALSTTRSAHVTLDLLLAHRAGLDGHRPLYAPRVTGGRVDVQEAYVTAANARHEDCAGDVPAGGFSPVYSDLGYLLAGAAMATRTGLDLDELVRREVTEPLALRIGSARQLRARDPSFDALVAPTEVVEWRGGTIRGAVHDENAWAIAGDATAGHAGLFGDAASLVELGLAILDVSAGRRPSFLSPSDLEPLVRDRPGGSLLAGFDRRSGAAPSSGACFGPRTFGHLGFTGTSLWIDPDAELVGVLLTNRVHPTRATDAIRRARPAVYDAIAVAMLSAR